MSTAFTFRVCTEPSIEQFWQLYRLHTCVLCLRRSLAHAIKGSKVDGCFPVPSRLSKYLLCTLFSAGMYSWGSSRLVGPRIPIPAAWNLKIILYNAQSDLWPLSAAQVKDFRRKRNDIWDLTVQAYYYHLVKYITAGVDRILRHSFFMLRTL